MTQDAQRSRRSDAARNRERLLTAARRAFAERGPDVALEEIASAADVSRTTLYRNFATREELAVTVFEDNVGAIEQRSADLGDRADGIVQLFDFVLAMQRDNRSLARVLSGANLAWLTGLSNRTMAAFEPHLERGRQAGIVRPGVGIQDVMLAFPMAAGVMADDEASQRELMTDRVRAMLHRALFSEQAHVD
ncbi:TetR/AcrR family transcriptional regulator [Streptomyces sp. NPDC090499]|uniref:TetR/AcrR family transcriptional regulator n=1 Tax=unclassified Streptomyces TaxID=2593676 RepID=UPI0037F11DA2